MAKYYERWRLGPTNWITRRRRLRTSVGSISELANLADKHRYWSQLMFMEVGLTIRHKSFEAVLRCAAGALRQHYRRNAMLTRRRCLNQPYKVRRAVECAITTMETFDQSYIDRFYSMSWRNDLMRLMISFVSSKAEPVNLMRVSQQHTG